ncbi:uncharacterized protein LOC141714958 [Apium graveolens]|uniref:uncharacterized protein LOC141714958 n=1 Tax=Apium graveolens TaxID=4045 RepID=UPI003D7B672F
MCMKKPYMFMTNIVSGPNSTGKDINVCLRPLIDELKILWNTGVKTFGSTNRIFLESNDPLRQKSNLFDNEERRLFRGRLSGEGVEELLDGLVFPPPGKTNLKARSVGYGEEYGTIVNTAKSKDHKKARADCKHFGVLPHFWIDEKGKSPKTPYSLTRKQRKLLCKRISSLKLPDGYSSNISCCCNVEECTFYGFKSHDCHIFLQKLLPLTIRELLPAPIADAIMKISNFFQDLCSSVVTKTDLEIMEKSVIKALCLLEMISPQSWFNSMEHLVVHLAKEIRLAGPAYWHWMYPIERLLGKLKQKVGNKARVEGSIAERYMEEEILNICSFYFSSNTIHNKVRRNEVLFDVQNSENLEVFKYPIQSLGKEGTRYMSDDERELAEEYVLLNSPEVQPYLRKYQVRVMRQRLETTPHDLDRIVKSQFETWFKQKVDKVEVEGPHCRDLLEGPVLKVITFETCQVNGYKFSTKSASGSGIVVKGNLHGNNLDYYGQLQEIIRLIYQGCNHVHLFKCIWFDSVGNGVRIDKNRVITIDMTLRLNSNEIFILASQASQVYYAPSVLDSKEKIYTVVKSIVAQNDIEDAFQEDRSNALTSFSLFVDFAQYGQIPFIRREEDEEDEEDNLKDDEDENEGEEEISEGDNENNDDDEDDDGFK